MVAYKQADPRWKDIQLGTCIGETIGKSGCFITALGILAGKTPPEVNSLMKDNGGYASGCLIKYDRASALLGLTNEGRGKTLKRYPCIAWTDNFAPKGIPQHFFICLDGTNILDPLTGTQRVNPYKIVEYIHIYPKEEKEDTLSAAEQQELNQLRTFKNEIIGNRFYTYRINGKEEVYQVYHIPTSGHFDFLGNRWEDVNEVPEWTDNAGNVARIWHAVQELLSTKSTLTLQQSVNDSLRATVQSMKDHPITVEKIVTKEVIKEVPVEKIVTVEKIIDLNEKVAAEAAKVALENVELHRQLTSMTFGEIILAFWNKIKNK